MKSLEAAAKQLRIKERVSADLDMIKSALDKHSYSPSPYIYRRIEKKKKRGQYRGIYSARCSDDKIVQYAIKQTLDSLYEPRFKPCSYAYRKGYSAISAIKDIKSTVDYGYRWAVKLDICKFFDSIPRKMLFEKLNHDIEDSAFLMLIQRFTDAGYLHKGRIMKTDEGVRQGLIIAPILANIYLHTLDEEWCSKHQNLGKMFRYCDDILILSNGRKKARKALREVMNILYGLGLRYESEGPIRLDNQPVEFLGFVHRMNMGELVQLPTEQALQYIKQELGSQLSASDIQTKVAGWRNFYSVNELASQQIEELISACGYQG